MSSLSTSDNVNKEDNNENNNEVINEDNNELESPPKKQKTQEQLPTYVWFSLWRDGVLAIEADELESTGLRNIAGLKKAVHKELEPELDDIAAGRLTVYEPQKVDDKAKANFAEGKFGRELDPRDKVPDTCDGELPILVVAPKKTTPDSGPTVDQIRWERLGKFNAVEESNCLLLQEPFQSWIICRAPRLFIQSAYPELFKLCELKRATHTGRKNMEREGNIEYVDDSEGVFIVGNPGTGKSCFLDYALYQYIKMQKTVLYLHEGQSRAYQFSDGNVKMCNMKVETLIFRHAWGSLAKNFDIVLLEPSENDGSKITRDFLGGAFFIAAMSPDKRNYQALRKNAKYLNLYLGVLSKAEALSMWESCYKDRPGMHLSKKVVQERYNVIDGIPRYLFKASDAENEKDDTIVAFKTYQLSALSTIFEDTKEAETVDSFSKFKGRWSLYHLIPPQNEEGKKSFDDYIVVPKNDATRVLIKQHLLKKNVQELWETYYALGDRSGALRGIFYECYVHKKILADGLSGEAWKLYSGESKNPKHHRVEVPRKSEEVKFEGNRLRDLTKALDKAKSFCQGAYVIPLSLNFPVLDSVFVKGEVVYVFQIKAGRSDPLSQSTMEILEACGTRKLIFLTPDETVMQKPLSIKKGQKVVTKEKEARGHTPDQYRLFVRK